MLGNIVRLHALEKYAAKPSEISAGSARPPRIVDLVGFACNYFRILRYIDELNTIKNV